MRSLFQSVALAACVLTFSASMLVRAEDTKDPPSESPTTKVDKAKAAKEAAKERAEKAKAEAKEKLKKKQRDKILQTLGSQKEGNFLVALEEESPTRVTGVNIAHQQSRDDAADEILEFLEGGDGQVRRSYQVLARFEANDRGKTFAGNHQKRLQDYMNVRLKDPSFTKDPCYSDLVGNRVGSINQGLSDGTIIRYVPFKK